jgi:hypothetical protein
MRLSFGVLVFRAGHPDIEPDSQRQTRHTDDSHDACKIIGLAAAKPV